MVPIRLEKPPPFASSSGQVLAAGETSLWRIFVVSSMAAGIQFGWAIQLSLLTPYVQLLGIPHKWASYIWFFGPISAIIVQPLVGHYSDRCTSRFGRRRPFIAAGAILTSVAVCLIGYAADIGYLSGDVWEKGKTKTRAIAAFGVGFWILEVANNTLQVPCRAFLADLSGGNASKTRIANSFFSFFMAVGNILGYSAGSYDNLHKLYPFNATAACDQDCTNLKNCFFLSIILLGSVTLPALTMVREQPWSPADVNVIHQEEKPKLPFFQQLFGALKDLPRSMWVLLLVTSMNWIGWFPFLLFDIDWMGREVYGGDRNLEQGRMYGFGVRAGEVGLVLNSVVLGIVSLLIEPLCRLLGKVKRLWGIANLILGICLGMTVLVSRNAAAWRHLAAANSINTLQTQPPTEIKNSALVIFAILGIPTAVTYSIPFALASIFSNSVGAGQGLSLGVLNMAIVFPQLIVSLTSGSINSLFCGGNLPGFVMGAIAAVISSILAFTVLPSPIPERN